MKKRNHRSADFKASVALAALRGEETISELSLRYSIHSTQILSWKSAAIKNLSSVFSGSSKKDIGHDLGSLERKIGQLTMENDFLKKAWEGHQTRKGGL
jgi:transposase-like protein